MTPRGANKGCLKKKSACVVLSFPRNHLSAHMIQIEMISSIIHLRWFTYNVCHIKTNKYDPGELDEFICTYDRHDKGKKSIKDQFRETSLICV